MASVPVTGSGSVDRREDGGGELHPAATRALAQAAAEGSRDLSESGLLCSVLLTIAVGCLGWSVPTPGASAVLAFLCMVLIAVEHTGARRRFQRAVVRAGKEHGVAAPEAERAARGLVEAAESARRGV